MLAVILPTQARDLSLLDAKYKVMAVQPVDMFPHTHHVGKCGVARKKRIIRIVNYKLLNSK